jgi:hypothetical protein
MQQRGFYFGYAKGEFGNDIGMLFDCRSKGDIFTKEEGEKIVNNSSYYLEIVEICPIID